MRKIILFISLISVILVGGGTLLNCMSARAVLMWFLHGREAQRHIELQGAQIHYSISAMRFLQKIITTPRSSIQKGLLRVTDTITM